MKEKKFSNWFKKHKTKLLVAGGVIVTTVGTVLLIDNWDLVKGFIVKEVKNVPAKSLDIKPDVTNTTVVDSEPVIRIIDVREHLRNLPCGYHPSAQKVAKAVELGIELDANQTIVSAHPRCYVA